MPRIAVGRSDRQPGPVAASRLVRTEFLALPASCPASSGPIAPLGGGSRDPRSGRPSIDGAGKASRGCTSGSPQHPAPAIPQRLPTGQPASLEKLQDNFQSAPSRYMATERPIFRSRPGDLANVSSRHAIAYPNTPHTGISTSRDRDRTQTQQQARRRLWMPRKFRGPTHARPCDGRGRSHRRLWFRARITSVTGKMSARHAISLVWTATPGQGQIASVHARSTTPPRHRRTDR